MRDVPVGVVDVAAINTQFDIFTENRPPDGPVEGTAEIGQQAGGTLIFALEGHQTAGIVIAVALGDARAAVGVGLLRDVPVGAVGEPLGVHSVARRLPPALQSVAVGGLHRAAEPFRARAPAVVVAVCGKLLGGAVGQGQPNRRWAAHAVVGIDDGVRHRLRQVAAAVGVLDCGRAAVERVCGLRLVMPRQVVGGYFPHGPPLGVVFNELQQHRVAAQYARQAARAQPGGLLRPRLEKAGFAIEPLQAGEIVIVVIVCGQHRCIVDVNVHRVARAVDAARAVP